LPRPGREEGKRSGGFKERMHAFLCGGKVSSLPLAILVSSPSTAGPRAPLTERRKGRPGRRGPMGCWSVTSRRVASGERRGAAGAGAGAGAGRGPGGGGAAEEALAAGWDPRGDAARLACTAPTPGAAARCPLTSGGECGACGPRTPPALRAKDPPHSHPHPRPVRASAGPRGPPLSPKPARATEKPACSWGQSHPPSFRRAPSPH
jgi:hypothetical protein